MRYNLTNVQLEDINNIIECNDIPWEKLDNKVVFVTGATGLIGITLVNALLERNIFVIALVRDLEKATFFLEGKKNLELIVGDVLSLPRINRHVDYVIHAAGPTSSRSFVTNPISTMDIIINGTKNVLELAREKEVKGFVFLSSMEVFGFPPKGMSVSEQFQYGFNTVQARNSYPIGKIAAEALCSAFYNEYDLPIKIVRLTQTFGPGVVSDDGRVFAYFLNSAIDKTNIVLKTKGETERSYLYTADAVTAILTVLLKGTANEIYNVANPATYCSILDMALTVAKEIMSGTIDVLVEEEKDDAYAPTLYMNLNTDKITNLGWQPHYNLKEMFERMIQDRKERLEVAD